MRVPMIQIFLSHNTRDRAWCEWLMREAALQGIMPYLAEHDVQAGKSLAEKVEAAIDASVAVVVLITDNSVSSQYVQQEIGYARKAKKLIIPVVQTGIAAEQLGMLQGVEYVSFDFDSPHEGHAQLICRVVCQVGVFDCVRVAGGLGGRESGAPGSVSALPV
jgi:hypothetical protein